MRSLALALMALLLAAAEPGAAQARKPASVPPPAPVAVRTWTSQTAVWAGDRFEYVIELRRPANVEVFLDDLLPEKLQLDNLEVVETATEHDASSADSVVDRLRYTLASYAVAAQTIGIAPISVRYSIRRAGEKAEGALPAGEFVVPALHVGLRSTLTPTSEGVEIRDRRPLQPVPERIRLAERIGWVLLALSAMPIAAAAVRVVQRVRRTRPARPARTPVRQRRAALEDIKVADVSTATARREAYAALDAWIRDSIQLPGGATAAALTPEEAAAAVAGSKPPEWRGELERVLLECERAKYGLDVPSQDRWPAAVDTAATLVLNRPLS